MFTNNFYKRLTASTAASIRQVKFNMERPPLNIAIAFRDNQVADYTPILGNMPCPLFKKALVFVVPACILVGRHNSI